jgi:hypothetical protein
MGNWEIAPIIAARASCTTEYDFNMSDLYLFWRRIRFFIILTKLQSAHLLPRVPPALKQQRKSHHGSKRLLRQILLKFAGLRAALEGETREREQSRCPSTNLLNPSRVRTITQRELNANTFPYKLNSTVPAEIKRSRAWIRYHLSGTKRGGQGFVIMDAHTDKDGNRSSALFDQMPKLCDNPWYSKKFQTIFQKLHAKEARGDGKRKQAKMTELINLAALVRSRLASQNPS